MKSRAAPSIGAVLCLVLFGAGPCRALSLRNSAAEVFVGDVRPGTTVASSRAKGRRLRVVNTGRDPVRIEFQAVAPPVGGVKDGYEPWTFPIRLESSHAEVGPGEAAEADVSVDVPKKGADGGQYEFDVLATGHDRAGASLTVKTRVLLSVGEPLARAEEAGAFADRPGYALSPKSATGRDATVKIVNAGDEDLTVTLTPARDWSGDVRIADGYEPAPNPRWLRFEPGVVKVRAGAIGQARIEAFVPRQKRYAGRRWAFVAAVDAQAHGRTTRRYFVLHVITSDLEEETQAP